MADNFREHYADEMQRALDPYAHALTTIDTLHRLTHDGFVYHVSNKVTGMANGNVDDYLISIPAGVFPHFQRLQITAGEGNVDMLVYEGTTTSADGTVEGSLNVNRNSTNTASSVLTIAPTVTDEGTLIHTQWVPPSASGVGQSPQGVIGETNGEEWVMKPSTKYLIRITNNSGSTIDYRYELLWYEIGYEQ